jgi:CRISPR-associated protein Cas2
MKKYLVVIIYDISDDRRRTKLGKYLLGFGLRIQNSAFECYINDKVYKRLMSGIKRYIKDEDLIKTYKIDLQSRVINKGISPETEIEEVIIV